MLLWAPGGTPVLGLQTGGIAGGLPASWNRLANPVLNNVGGAAFYSTLNSFTDRWGLFIFFPTGQLTWCPRV